MSLYAFLRQLTEKDDRVPFIPDIDYRDPTDFPEGIIVHSTDQVYHAMLGMVPRRWMDQQREQPAVSVSRQQYTNGFRREHRFSVRPHCQ